MRFQEGMIVKSGAGRDREGYFVIVRTEEGFAYLADGKRRPFERPKRKSFRHLKQTSCWIDLAQVHTNPRLRRALRPWNDPQDPGEGTPPAAEQEGIACQNRT